MADWQTVSGVRFRDTGQGDLDESDIDKEETDLGDHYLFGEGDDKNDYSFPVVDAEGILRAQNVLSAWTRRRFAPVSKSEMKDLIQPLNNKFDDPPINFDENESMARIQKNAEIIKTDSDRQVAVGVAMEPNSVDLAGDFERPETIRKLADRYMTRLNDGESRNGVMHSVFPDTETISHVENRVLTEETTLGDTTYDPGTWVVGKQIHDDALWKLVESGALPAFSIGGRITAERHYDEAPEGVIETETVKNARQATEVTEIVDGEIEEISLVDVPAVPNAKVQLTKNTAEKAAPELTDTVESAREYLINERGHEADSATALAEFLNRDPTEQKSMGWVDRAKAFFTGSETEKTGQTLSAQNVAHTKAIHDRSLAMLHDAGYAPRRRPFSQTDIETSKDESDIDEPAESGAATLDTMSDDNADAIIDKLDALESQLSDDDDGETEDELLGRIESLEEKMGEDDDVDSDRIETLETNQEKLTALIENLLDANGMSQQDDGSNQTTETSKYAGSAFDPSGGEA